MTTPLTRTKTTTTTCTEAQAEASWAGSGFQGREAWQVMGRAEVEGEEEGEAAVMVARRVLEEEVGFVVDPEEAAGEVVAAAEVAAVGDLDLDDEMTGVL